MRQYDLEHAKDIAARAIGIGKYAKKGDDNWRPISI
jgi:hypothetical protein